MILMNFSIGNPNSWKFISSRDLTNTDLNEFVKRYDSIESELVVHAPEYYEDKLIDFATDQSNVLDYSFEMLERTIDLSRKLSPIFKGTDQNLGPKIVVHYQRSFRIFEGNESPRSI